ncbi:MAG: response regulator transcription factor [Anaerolineae bacterium]|nr:response regulator transcription factor [Anaerolineae bacterium]
MYAILLSQDPDEDAIWGMLLRRAGLVVNAVNSLERARRLWSEQPPALILAALEEPLSPEAVRTVRAETPALLVVLVDRAEEKTLCELLEGGVDLVLPRATGPRLVLAQVRALLRRAQEQGLVLNPPRLTLAHFTLDPATRTVQVSDRPPRRLTPLEFRLLYTLMIHRGQVLPTEIIVERVWGYGGEGESALVRRLVHRLRAKVEPDARRPRYILTVPGVGYTFEAEEG